MYEHILYIIYLGLLVITLVAVTLIMFICIIQDGGCSYMLYAIILIVCILCSRIGSTVVILYMHYDNNITTIRLGIYEIIVQLGSMFLIFMLLWIYDQWICLIMRILQLPLYSPKSKARIIILLLIAVCIIAIIIICIVVRIISIAIPDIKVASNINTILFVTLLIALIFCIVLSLLLSLFLCCTYTRSHKFKENISIFISVVICYGIVVLCIFIRFIIFIVNIFMNNATIALIGFIAELIAIWLLLISVTLHVCKNSDI